MNFKDYILRQLGAADSRGAADSDPLNYSNAAKTKPAATDAAVINQIVSEFRDRTRKQIKQWREAMQLCEDVDDPRWYLQQDLYDDTIDAHLASVVDTRKMTTTNHRFYVIDKKNKEILDEQTDFLDKQWFFDFLDETLNAMLKGYSALQILNSAPGSLPSAPGPMPVLSVIPRRNVCPQKSRIYTEVSGSKFIEYATIPDFILVKHNSPFGLLNDVMPNCIWKKNAMQAWAEFGERFGMPLISATTANQQDIPRIQAMLKKMGEAAQAVLPHGTTITVHDLANAGNPQSVYDGQATFHDNQISKRLIGGTMVSDNGSSRSQSEVHERTLDAKISIADQRFCRFIINDKLFPVLQAMGYPFDNTKMDFTFDETEELSLTQHWAIVSDAATKFEFDDKGVEWIAKTFNIPVIGIKKAESEAKAEAKAEAEAETEAEAGKKKTEKKPKAGVKANFNAATTMRAMAVACNIVLPEYGCSGFHSADSKNHHHHPVSAEGLPKSLTDELNAFDEQIARYLYNDKLTDAQRERLLKGKRISEELRSGLFQGWGKNRLQAAWNSPDNRALAAMEINLFKFAEAKGRAEALLLNRLLVDKEKKQIRSERDFIEQAKKVNGIFNETYLKTERDFAIATGQNSARYLEFFNQKNQIATWQYQTVGDTSVRNEHASIDGRVFKFDDKEARRLWPPNGYKCRCEAIQFVGKPGNLAMSGKDALPVVFTNKKQLEQFGFNRADAGVVFNQNQMYLGTLKDAEGNNSVGKPINDYSFADYGLKKFSELRATLEGLKLDKTITPDNVKELFVNNAATKDYKAMGFEDYLKRKLILKENIFKNHTTGKYVGSGENRHQLFAHLTDVLNTADEVYLNNEKGNEQLRYIKVYKNKEIIIDCEITTDAFEIKTWYENKVDDKKRKGLLIK